MNECKNTLVIQERVTILPAEQSAPVTVAKTQRDDGFLSDSEII